MAVTDEWRRGEHMASLFMPEEHRRWDESRIDSWNAAIESEFFSGKYEGRYVYLDLEDDVIARVGSVALGMEVDAGTAQADLERAVRETLDLESSSVGVFAFQRKAWLSWAFNKQEGPPPFLGMIAFFSRVAQLMHASGSLAANNFYGRLAERLSVTRNHHRLQPDFRTESPKFYEALNDWINDSDGFRGIATAYTLDHRAYVSVPIGQALVRERDRGALERFYALYEFRPHQSVTHTDMVRYLEEWLPKSGISATIKRQWRLKDVKDRVAEVARQGLRSWTGPVAPEDLDDDSQMPTSRASRIRLAALLSRWQGLRLDLSLVVERRTDLAPGEYRLGDGASEAAQAAFEDTGGAIFLSSGSSPEWMVVDNSPSVSFADLLEASALLTSTAGAEALEYRPRRVVVLRAEPSLPGQFVGTDRAELGTNHMFLVREQAVLTVKGYLEDAARHGFKLLDETAVAGCPPGWRIFSDIQLVDLVEIEGDDFAALVPREWTRVSFEGGLRLNEGQVNRDRWHRSAPPEIVVAAHSAANATIALTRVNSDQDEVDPVVQLDFEESISSDLPVGLEPGRYEAVLGQRNEDGQEFNWSERRSLSLVSADDRRPGLGGWVGHDLSNARGALFASNLENDPGGSTSRGAQISSMEGVIESDAPSKRNLPESLSNYEQPAQSDPEMSEHVDRWSRDSVRRATSSSCVGSGHHYFMLPPPGAGPAQGGMIPGSCRDCGLTKRFNLFPNRAVLGSGPQASNGVRTLSPIKNDIRIETTVTCDTLFDALCYFGQGDWNLFKRLTSHVDNAPYFASEFASTLSALGHVDITIDKTSYQPIGWKVSPPCMVSTAIGDGHFLAGFRSDTFLSRMKEQVDGLGGHVELEQLDGAPSRVSVSGVDIDTAGVIDGLDLGEEFPPLHYVGEVATDLVAILPSISKAVDELPRRPLALMADLRAKEFDFQGNKYKESFIKTDRHAVYQMDGPTTWYGIADGQELTRVDYRVAKIIGSAFSGIPFLAYREDESQLVSKVGYRLPGLYERVACLCSGRPSVPMSDGQVRLVYSGVPVEIASALWNKLGQG
jgi:hypothetical protein